ncbi:CopG domain protein DNA-binding domain protein [Dethiosulfovibrio peptidovorans DSM 11002]|jgi:RHH-type rel operon transcriptional repressor/antitoxin RelB|uniref:Relaxosome protein TraY n=1 Tax=Dethiosulfovibrio peptidovorans DSM 11002 TaxID=469381 RepID=D2Z5V8_9BACT|nr:DUF6290 family protein [Dethiosulfovibrio peptidovorans]EFC90855.1 CopG domain protein DNA-binding domain protein [Dethiosulfovibrio peptidovorans DSM 11002]
MKSVITVKLDEELNRMLSERAAREGRSKSFYVREGLIQYLEDLEDIEAAEAGYKDWAADNFKTHRWEDVRSRLGLDD